MAIQIGCADTLGIDHPILLAPMDIVSGGGLSAGITVTLHSNPPLR